MKVVHLETGTHLYGGALQVLLLVEGLEKAGVQNLLVVPKGSEVEAEATQRGLPVSGIAMAGEADLAFPFRFGKLLKEEDPDLVHLHSRRGADTLGALAVNAAQIPTILSRRVDNPEAEWSLAAKYRLYDRVITISRAIYDLLVSQGVPTKKVRCVHSALDSTPYLEPRDPGVLHRKLGLPDGAPLVGMAAQFIKRKGHRTLLEAAPLVLQDHPDTHFVLFGRGPLQPDMEGLARELELVERVHFPGFRDDLHKVLPCLDLLAHPASKEGLGIILLQASAAGLPIVATRAGGIPEAVVDGETGLLVDPGDAGALGGAIATLLDDPVRRREMGSAGRARVRDFFSVERMVEGNLAVYQELLGL